MPNSFEVCCKRQHSVKICHGSEFLANQPKIVLGTFPDSLKPKKTTN